MKHFSKIKTYSEIKNIINNGVKTVKDEFILYTLEVEKINIKYIKNYQNGKIIYAVLTSRKFGKAVSRNLAKRRILAKLTLERQGLSNRTAYVFIPRRKIL